jgi:pyruvate dehydrogenase E2 component (dihydrolipoamide acetyltransferase)
MRVEVIMPRLGQSMEEGRIVSWLKPIGAKVSRGEVIAEIETDKATVDLESLISGTLVEIIIAEGETIPTGTSIALIDDGLPESETIPGTSPKKQLIPDSEERINASPVARRLAEEHGIDLKLVQASDPNRFISKADIEAYLAQHEAGKREAEIVSSRVNVSPVARQMAVEHNIDVNQISGSGPAGRIVRADVEAWLAAHKTEPHDKHEDEEFKRIPLPKIKQTTARRMSESKASVPHFYASIDIELSRSLVLRDSLKSRNIDVSINDLILRATALALVKYPNLNATFANNELHVFPHINLAVAVALEDGLITPVIRHCESLSLAELAKAARTVIDRARTGHLRPEDLEDGTFTVSNLGMFGVKNFQAIVNPPQAAILAVGVLRRIPVFDTFDRLVPAQMITASVSADHRVTDGAEVSRFLQELKRLLEDAFELV